jgi:hypothetical protein
MIRLQVKKGWLGIAPSQPLNLTPTLRFSSDSNNAYDACEIDGPYNSTAVQCSKTFGKMDNRRSSCSSCAGNIHIPGIRSHNDIRGNRIRPRLLRSRLKPERQLVLPEPEPVRLLPMEVKEVFSYISPLFVRLRGMRTPAKEFIGAYENRAPLPLLNYESNPACLAVPRRDEKERGFQRANFRAFSA